MLRLSPGTAKVVFPIVLWVSLLLLAALPAAGLWIAYSTDWLSGPETPTVLRLERLLVLLGNAPSTLITAFVSSLPLVTTAVSFRGPGRAKVLSLQGGLVLAAFALIGAMAFHNLILFNPADEELARSLTESVSVISSIHTAADRVLTIALGSCALLLGLNLEVKP